MKLNMKYPAIFAFTVGCTVLVLSPVANAGGYAEPVMAPEIIRPMPRPDVVECRPFLWWTICDAENPSPKRTDKDEKERPVKPSRPALDDTPSDSATPDPAPDGGPAPSVPAEPPAAPEAPEPDKPPKTPDVDQPVDRDPPAKPKPPKQDKKPGHGYGDKNHDHKNKEEKR